MHAFQRERTRDLLKSRGIDRALFAHPDSVKWLTGYAPQVQLGGNHFAGGPALVWYEDGHFTLIVLDMDAEHAGSFGDARDCSLVTYRGYAAQEPIRSHEHIDSALDRVVGEAGPIAAELHALPAFLYDTVRKQGDVTSIDRWLVPLRMVKTEEEIALLRRNFELTDLGHRVAAETTRPGRREIDVWTAIHSAINQEVGFRIPLGNDCVVDHRNPNNIGGWPKDFEIREGTALVVDLSTAYRGYWSDSCNVYYASEPTTRQREVRAFVQDALDYAISLIRPGVTCSEIDGKVRAFMDRGGYPVYPHHTGHGVGASVHEEPRITPYNHTPLEENMVIMLEPGVYEPGVLSCRLEHGLLVTSDGAEVLTTHIDRL